MARAAAAAALLVVVWCGLMCFSADGGASRGSGSRGAEAGAGRGAGGRASGKEKTSRAARERTGMTAKDRMADAKVKLRELKRLKKMPDHIRSSAYAGHKELLQRTTSDAAAAATLDTTTEAAALRRLERHVSDVEREADARWNGTFLGGAGSTEVGADGQQGVPQSAGSEWARGGDAGRVASPAEERQRGKRTKRYRYTSAHEKGERQEIITRGSLRNKTQSRIDAQEERLVSVMSHQNIVESRYLVKRAAELEKRKGREMRKVKQSNKYSKRRKRPGHEHWKKYGENLTTFHRYRWAKEKSRRTCPLFCSGHGVCGTWNCTCFPEWEGIDCSYRKCPVGRLYVDADGTSDRVHRYSECSGRGLCNKHTGECECWEPFSGHACQRMDCPNECSDHGVCRYAGDVRRAPRCVCDEEFFGPDCSMRRCPFGDDPWTYDTVNNKQTVSITSTMADMVGHFTLIYEDVHGVLRETRPVEFPRYSEMETTAEKDAHAAHVRAHLLGLPDLVMYDIGVVAEKVQTCTSSLYSGSCSGGHMSGVKYTVEFNHSSMAGNMRPLRVNYIGCDNQGCQPRFNGIYTLGTVTVVVDALHEGSDRESVECSNHGHCDYKAGVCVCHEDFDGEACESIKVLH